MDGKKSKKMFSLSYKVFLMAVLISLLPMMIVGMMLYSRSSDIVKKNESATKMNTLAHIGTNVETIVQYVDDLSVLLIQDDIVKEWLQSTETAEDDSSLERLALERRLSLCVGNKHYISSISIENLEGKTAFVGTGRKTQLRNDARKSADEQKGSLIWVTDFEEWQSLNQNQKTISMVRSINDMNTLKKIATMRIEILAQDLSESFADEISEEESVTYMVDRAGGIIASEKKEMMGETAPEEIISEMDGESVMAEKEIDGETCMVTMYPLENIPWTLVNMVPIKYILSDSAVLRRILCVSLLLSMILCMFCSFVFSRICTRPLLALTDRLKIMDMKHIDMIHSNDEVGILVETYNNMSGYIEKLAEELAKKKIELKEAEFAALQAQINPHSLYNNLDTAFWLSRLEEAPRTGEIIFAMSRLYRMSLGNVNEIVTVAEELEYLENYLVLQKIRLEDMVNFQFDMEEEIKEFRMLRFVLQPIVENAVIHGILPKEKEGTVKIHIYKKKEMLIISVSDDGIGADCEYLNEILHEDIESSAETACFAIRNVNNRIRMRFGGDYGLHYESAGNGWTTAIISQPLLFPE